MKKDNKNIEIYQAKDGAIEISIDPKKETIWASQSDLCRLFKKDQSVISRHINKIFRDKEIEKKSNMQKMHIANSDKPVATRHLYRRLFRSTLLLDSILEMKVLFGVVS